MTTFVTIADEYGNSVDGVMHSIKKPVSKGRGSISGLVEFSFLTKSGHIFTAGETINAAVKIPELFGLEFTNVSFKVELVAYYRIIDRNGVKEMCFVGHLLEKVEHTLPNIDLNNYWWGSGIS